MTITSTGPSGFHLKPLVTVFAVAAIVTGVLAVIQVTGTESPQRTPAPASAEVPAEVVEPYTGHSGLAQALADGKLNAGFAAAPGQSFAGSAPVPEILVVEGQGGLHDALIAGKLTMDSADVRYVASPETAATTNGLWTAFDSGQLEEGTGDGGTLPMSPPASATTTVSGGHQE